MQNRNGIILSLSETLTEWMQTNEPFLKTPKIAELICSLSEALHFLLMSLTDSMESSDEQDVEMLLRVTEDRGQLMEEMRKKLFAEEESFSYENQRAIYSMTGLFERAVWLIRRVVLLLPRNKAHEVNKELTI